MKTIYAVLFFLCCAFLSAQAQEPVPDPDTLKNQVHQKDPTPDNIPPDANYNTDRTKITSAELPEQIKRTLNAGSEYKGWEKGKTYKSKDGKLYIIEMSEADTTRIFRFDKNGKLVLE